MFNKSTLSPLVSQKLQLAIIVFSYIILASIFGYANRYYNNPDGVSYLCLAGYIAEGNFQQSVTGYWGPLITWFMAPFLFFGVESLTVARIVVALSGLGLIVSSWLLSTRYNLSSTIRFITFLIAALLISRWSNQTIAPDLLLAALLIYYFYILTNPHILTHKKISFLCGIVGGFAYLAKHYAFPFFIVHFPLTLLLRGYLNKDKKGNFSKKVAISFISGMAGFLIISLPWILLISSKYQYLTFATSGRINHTIKGPNRIQGQHPSSIGLNKPKFYALNTWEDPSGMDYETWSPFESKEYFMYQVKSSITNIIIIIDNFRAYSFMIGLFSVCILPVVFLLAPLNSEKRFLYAWIMITLIIYCLGYILTWAEDIRYYYPIMIVTLLLSSHFLDELKNNYREVKVEMKFHRRKNLLTVYILTFFILSFTFKPAILFLISLKNIITTNQINVSRQIANQLNAISFAGPYAIIRPNRDTQKINSNSFIKSDVSNKSELLISYYLKKQYLGAPISSDLEGITKELDTVNASSLVVYDNPSIARKIKNNKRYSHKAHFKRGDIIGFDGEINIFIINK